MCKNEETLVQGVAAAGVCIRDNETGKFKCFYQILKEFAEIYDKISKEGGSKS